MSSEVLVIRDKKIEGSVIVHLVIKSIVVESGIRDKFFEFLQSLVRFLLELGLGLGFFLMHVYLTSRVRVRVRVCIYVYNRLHMLKRDEDIKYRVLLSSYLYVCSCDSILVHVQFLIRVYIW